MINFKEKNIEWNNYHKHILNSHEPLCITKIGSTEAISISNYIQTKGEFIDIDSLYGLDMSCGIHSSSNESHNEWCRQYIKGIVSSDYMHFWHEFSFNTHTVKNDPNIQKRLQNNLTDSFIYESLKHKMNLRNKPVSMHGTAIEPFLLREDAWHRKLNTTKVLVVSNAQKTFEYQAERYDKLWNGSTLGGFEFVKIPHSEYLTHDTQDQQLEWDEKVNNAKKEIAKKDFDFAMLGCGGIGLILVDYIKNELKKSCTYLGGSLLLFFGIRCGRRDKQKNGWYNSNEYWIKPFDEDTPKHYKIHENGSYWI